MQTRMLRLRCVMQRNILWTNPDPKYSSGSFSVRMLVANAFRTLCQAKTVFKDWRYGLNVEVQESWP
eukprot:40622-Eustigmatos_ZCMA.PRE.1